MLRKIRSLGALAILGMLGMTSLNAAATTVNKEVEDPAPAMGTPASPARYDPEITIAVFNDPQIAPDVIARAEKTAGKIFTKAGIQTIWLNCSAVSGYPGSESPCQNVPLNRRFDVRIVHDSMGLRSSVLGIAFLSEAGVGRQADVFYDGVAKIHRESNIDAATLLGHVTAHELGHLLLGANSHALSGLMRASWTRDELLTASMGGLLFSNHQSERMKARLPVIFSAAHVANCSASAC